MAEVVEINMICKNKIDISIMQEFLYKETQSGGKNLSIKAMDNWEYKNPIEIQPEDINDQLLSKKIICIEEIIEDGAVGIDIEIHENVVCYTLWLNHKKYDNSDEYYNLINHFLLLLNQDLRSHFMLCTIGKEVIFKYQSDHAGLFQKSHGIDIWVNLDIEFTDQVMRKYEKFELDDLVVLRRKNIDSGRILGVLDK